MLPIYVDIPCIIFNADICKEREVNLHSTMKAEEFITLLANVNQDNSLKDLYYYSNKVLNSYYFYQYLASFSNFSSSTFKDFARISKDKLNYTVNNNLGNIMLPMNLSFNKDNNFLFMLAEDSGYQIRSADNDKLRACGIPSIIGGKTNAATCYYLTVNPASKNLKEALQYISSLCKYLMSMNEYIMSKDRTMYPPTKLMDDFYEIYSNGDICFTYPDELYMEDFEKYLMGEKDLESMIYDSNRRVDTFLNE